MTITSSFMCLLILLLFCLSFGYSLHGHKNEASSNVNVVSNNAKVLKHVDVMEKLKVQGKSREEICKKTTKMKMKKQTKKETSVVEKDDLVAYTADYWQPRHHPPKNN